MQQIQNIQDTLQGATPAQLRMIETILEMKHTTAGDACTPRVDMMLCQAQETVKAAIDRMRGTGCSRLPVYAEDSDEIVGIVHYKDLMDAIFNEEAESELSKYMRPCFFVPESKNIISLLEEMKAKHTSMAIVIDEYGGTEGLITVEDIVEELFGDIEDESDKITDPIAKIDANTWRADGRLEIKEAIELGWPVKEGDDYDTLAGWLMQINDHVPDAGEEFKQDNYLFKIEKMRRNRIVTVRVKKLVD